MTLDTYSILDAASTLEHRRRQQTAAGKKTNTLPARRNLRTSSASQPPNNSTGPVDVVAVVMGVATLQSPLGSSFATTPRVDLRIADNSLPKHVTATVSMYGASELSRVAEQQISRGDVIRFNRLGIKRKRSFPNLKEKEVDIGRAETNYILAAQRRRQGGAAQENADDADDYDAVLPLDFPSSRAVESPICFEHPIDDPEPGWRWWKLGHIQAQDELDITDDRSCEQAGSSEGIGPERGAPFGGKLGRKQEQRMQSAFVTSYSDHTSVGTLPEEMSTAATRITELVAWYLLSCGGDHHEARGSAEGGVENAAASGAGTTKNAAGRGGDGDRMGGISPLPCKVRTLAEIQASPGVISNIYVRVTHSDAQVLPSYLAQYPRTAVKKGKRSLAKASSQPKQVIGFATVTDGTGTMTLVDPGNRYGTVLQMARQQNRNRILMMSNVLSTKQSNIYGQLLRTEEVVLWPSQKTSASLLPNNSISEDDIPGRNSLTKQTTPGTVSIQEREEGNKLSSSNHVDHRRISGEGERETQLTQGHPTIFLGERNDERRSEQQQQQYIFLESPLIDISVGEVSLRNYIDRSPLHLREIILSPDGTHYVDAIVKLKTTFASEGRLEQRRRRDENHDDEEDEIYRVFFAGSSVVKALCGGVNPAEWNVVGDIEVDRKQPKESVTAERARSGDGSVVARMAFRLLRSLLVENVLLEWTIDMTHEPVPKLIRVTVPTL